MEQCLMCFDLCPLPLVPSLGIMEKLLVFFAMRDAFLILKSPVSCCLSMLAFWIFQKLLLTGGLQLH